MFLFCFVCLFCFVLFCVFCFFVLCVVLTAPAVLSGSLASLTVRTTPGMHQAGAVCPGAADVWRRTPSTCVPADM